MNLKNTLKKEIQNILKENLLENKGTPRTVSLTSKKNSKYRNPEGASKYFAAYRQGYENVSEEIEPEEIKVSPKAFQDNLNPKIWNDNLTLKEEVKNKLIKIAKAYIDFLNIDANYKDIIITGSLANYNWTPHSDIDLHIIFDFEEIDENKELVKELMDAKKWVWNNKHDIKIYGFEVELYSQDVNEPHAATATFSLKDDEWINKPKHQKITIDTTSIKRKAANLINRIEKIKKIKSSEKKLELATNLKNKIKRMRKVGLDKKGEFSIENLTFKYLRNNGYLDIISDIITQAFDSDASLNENYINEKSKSKKQQNFFGMVRAYQKGELDKKNLPSGIKNKIDKISKSMSKEDVKDFASTKHKGLPEKINEIKKQKNTLAVMKDIEGMTPEKIEIIKKFINFTCAKLKMNEPVTVVLRNGRDDYILTTASYVPSSNENHIRTKGRALVDICRSIGHELTHNAQREKGIFSVGNKVQNIGGKIEDQANAIAGILIKDFTHNFGYDHIYDI